MVRGPTAIILICTGTNELSKLADSEIFEICKAVDTPVYAVSIAGLLDSKSLARMSSVQAKNRLDYITKLSRGQSYFPHSESELSTGYDELAVLLRAQ